MVRFVEMKGIYGDDTKSFGFYDTVRDKFIYAGGVCIFDSLKEFTDAYNDGCDFPLDRLEPKITDRWRKKIKIKSN